MCYFFLWIIFLLNPENFAESNSDPSICKKVTFYTRSVLKTHEVNKKFTFKKWNGRIGIEFRPVVEEYTDVEYRTKTIEVCCKGYTLLRGKCVPLCERVCENSECTAPNTCTCHEGYEKFNEFRCLPHCEKCVYGICSAPNICDCQRGYEKNENNVCQPLCDPKCVNGICSLPNTCSCLPGYHLAENSSFYCIPACVPPCDSIVNGSRCVGPNFCECPKGYKMNDVNNLIRNCTPICDIECENGYCSAPDTCSCYSGYKIDKHEHFRCNPICNHCQNGNCVAPDQCNCLEGYAKNLKGECSPQCSKPCINSYCSNSETCTCYNGYENNYEDPYTCFPMCEGGCGYGNCTEPGNCTCLKTSKWNYDTKTCELISKYEEDSIDDPGELLDFNTSTKQDESKEEYCDPPCVNGICTDGICHCFQGYYGNDESNECRLKCDNDCNENGTCFSSYGRIFRNGTECEPFCTEECVNGICIDSNVCECFKGYVPVHNQTKNYCIPLCDNNEVGCINGTCVSPNNCSCFEGFELSADNKFLCEPKFFGNQHITSDSSTWPLYLCLVILILVSIVLGFYISQRTFGEKVYNVDQHENFKGILKYNKKSENVSVI